MPQTGKELSELWQTHSGILYRHENERQWQQADWQKLIPEHHTEYKTVFYEVQKQAKLNKVLFREKGEDWNGR